MHKKRSKNNNNNKQTNKKKNMVYYKTDLTQVLNVYLEVVPLKSLGSEFQSYAPINSNDFFIPVHVKMMKVDVMA